MSDSYHQNPKILSLNRSLYFLTGYWMGDLCKINARTHMFEEKREIKRAKEIENKIEFCVEHIGYTFDTEKRFKTHKTYAPLGGIKFIELFQVREPEMAEIDERTLQVDGYLLGLKDATYTNVVKKEMIRWNKNVARLRWPLERRPMSIYICTMELKILASGKMLPKEVFHWVTPGTFDFVTHPKLLEFKRFFDKYFIRYAREYHNWLKENGYENYAGEEDEYMNREYAEENENQEYEDTNEEDIFFEPFEEADEPNPNDSNMENSITPSHLHNSDLQIIKSRDGWLTDGIISFYFEHLQRRIPDGDNGEILFISK